MKNIGIFGGTFDPPHIGHIIIADQIYHKCHLDEIWFMPNNLPPHKEKKSNSTVTDRLNMLKLAIEDTPYFKIEPIELERSGKSYTYDTIILLKQRNPGLNFKFIIGADMVDYLPKWHKIDQLIDLVEFLAVKRPTYEGKSPYPVRYVEAPEIHLSSSIVREKIEKGESVNFLLPEKIVNYIKEHGLYGSK